MDAAETRRREISKAVFPSGIPRLWCPLLTHYRDDGGIDFERMTAHFQSIVPWVKGYLIPGSTGDGWELDDGETAKVVEFALRAARQHRLCVLLGILRTDTAAMKRLMGDMIKALQSLSGVPDEMASLQKGHVCGFTVCPPKGKNLSQEDIFCELITILDRALPVALYQLPQVTENEVSPKTFERLAEAYPNLIFFKDSSGRDGIALSAADKGGVFLVRGAEGEYARWLRESGGPYDGFLLSTANCFPRELHAVIENLEKKAFQNAEAISERVTGVVREVFALVQPFPKGNAFTNANKAIDHFMAHGPSASKQPPPMLHAGVRLPEATISETGKILERFGLMPGKGYLE